MIKDDLKISLKSCIGQIDAPELRENIKSDIRKIYAKYNLLGYSVDEIEYEIDCFFEGNE